MYVLFLDELNQDFFSKIYAEYEKVCQECLDEAEQLKVRYLFSYFYIW